jgi:predicted transcriptional regulator of viral defense system
MGYPGHKHQQSPLRTHTFFVAIICHIWHNIVMKFKNLLALVGDQPLFETGLLLAGDVDPDDVRRQLSRWVNKGKIRQLRRGLYMLEPPYQSVVPHPFLIANALVPGSYVSEQSALAYCGLIPEYAPRTVSVTTLRPSQWDGSFYFQHIAPHFYFGYQSVTLSPQQRAFVAKPEKALLDLIHLTPHSDSPEYLSQLRLQNLEKLDLDQLHEFAERARKPKWKRAARYVTELAKQEDSEYEELT